MAELEEGEFIDEDEDGTSNNRKRRRTSGDGKSMEIGNEQIGDDTYIGRTRQQIEEDDAELLRKQLLESMKSQSKKTKPKSTQSNKSNTAGPFQQSPTHQQKELPPTVLTTPQQQPKQKLPSLENVITNFTQSSSAQSTPAAAVNKEFDLIKLSKRLGSAQHQREQILERKLKLENSLAACDVELEEKQEEITKLIATITLAWQNQLVREKMPKAENTETMDMEPAKKIPKLAVEPTVVVIESPPTKTTTTTMNSGGGGTSGNGNKTRTTTSTGGGASNSGKTSTGKTTMTSSTNGPIDTPLSTHCPKPPTASTPISTAHRQPKGVLPFSSLPININAAPPSLLSKITLSKPPHKQNSKQIYSQSQSLSKKQRYKIRRTQKLAAAAANLVWPMMQPDQSAPTTTSSASSFSFVRPVLEMEKEKQSSKVVEEKKQQPRRGEGNNVVTEKGGKSPSKSPQIVQQQQEKKKGNGDEKRSDEVVPTINVGTTQPEITAKSTIGVPPVAPIAFEDELEEGQIVEGEEDEKKKGQTLEGAKNDGKKTEKDGQIMNGKKPEKNDQIMNGKKSEKDGQIMNGKKSEKDGQIMNGKKPEKNDQIMNGKKSEKDGQIMNGKKSEKDGQIMNQSLEQTPAAEEDEPVMDITQLELVEEEQYEEEVSPAAATATDVVDENVDENVTMKRGETTTPKQPQQEARMDPFLMSIHSYRLSPGFPARLIAHPAVSNRLNPFIPLCPYQLTGRCADRKCNFQHEEDYTLSEKEIVEQIIGYWPKVCPCGVTPSEYATKLLEGGTVDQVVGFLLSRVPESIRQFYFDARRAPLAFHRSDKPVPADDRVEYEPIRQKVLTLNNALSLPS